MKNIGKYCVLVLLILILSACGSRKSPTGGPEDTEKPIVLTTLPAPYGQLTNGKIEINFSKPLDKSSVTQAVYVYPPVSAKKISVDRSTLQIQFNEDLQPDTNYYVTLSTRLKDIRGNALAEDQTLVFAHGKLNNLRLSGAISCEDPADQGQPVKISLLSADSLQVMQRSFTGGSYSLEALNPADYILRAYIDKDLNGRYDFAKEPWFEGSAQLRSDANLDLHLAYADTTKPMLTLVQAKSQREIELTFSEPVAQFGSVRIFRTDNKNELPVLLSQLRENKLTLLTEIQDAFAYSVEVRGAQDRKGNQQTLSRADLRSSPLIDTSAPQVLTSNPRNGSSVANLQPVLELRFSEIVPARTLKAVLRSTETSSEVPLDILQADSDIIRIQPRQALQNYRSYTLEVNAADISGNKIPGGYKLSFLPLLRTE